VLPACPRSIRRTHSCGTQAILNLILNIDDATASEHGIKLGEEIKNFKEFTQCLPADVSSIFSRWQCSECWRIYANRSSRWF